MAVLWLITVGVMVLGSAHVLCALRYLAGRISDAVTETTGWLLVVIVATMAWFAS